MTTTNPPFRDTSRTSETTADPSPAGRRATCRIAARVVVVLRSCDHRVAVPPADLRKRSPHLIRNERVGGC